MERETYHDAGLSLEIGGLFPGLAKLIPPEIQRRFLLTTADGGQDQKIRQELASEFQMNLTWVPPEMLFGLVGLSRGATPEYDSIVNTSLKENLMNYMTNHPGTVFIVCKGLARMLYQNIVLGKEGTRQIPGKIERDPAYFRWFIDRKKLDWDVDFWVADLSGGFDLEEFVREFSVGKFSQSRGARVVIRESPRKEEFKCVNVYVPAGPESTSDYVSGVGGVVRHALRALLRRPFAHFCALDERSLVATLVREADIPPTVLVPKVDQDGKVVDIGGVIVDPFVDSRKAGSYTYSFEERVFPKDKPGWCLEGICNALVDCAYDRMSPEIGFSPERSDLIFRAQATMVTKKLVEESTHLGLRINFLKANAGFAVRKLIEAFQGDPLPTVQRCLAWGLFEKEGIFPGLEGFFQGTANFDNLPLLNYLIKRFGSAQKAAEALMPPWYPGTTAEFAMKALAPWNEDFADCRTKAEEKNITGQEERIRELIENSPEPVTSGELAACLRKTQEAVWGGLNKMRKQGKIVDLSLHPDLVAIRANPSFQESKKRPFIWTPEGRWMTTERAGDFGTRYYSEVSLIYAAVKMGSSDPVEGDYVSLKEIQERTGLPEEKILDLVRNLNNIVGKDQFGYFISSQVQAWLVEK